MLQSKFFVPESDNTFTKFKWVQTKLGGAHFSPRCSLPLVPTSNLLSAYCYGGVFDVEDDEENLSGIFFDDMFQLDLDKLCWRTVTLTGKKERDTRKRKQETDDDNGKKFVVKFKSQFTLFHK